MHVARSNCVRDLELRLQSLESFCADLQICELAARLAPQKEAQELPLKEGQPKPSSGSHDSECPAEQDVLERCRSIAADNQKLLLALRNSRRNFDRKAQQHLWPSSSTASSTVSGGSGCSTPSLLSPRGGK